MYVERKFESLILLGGDTFRCLWVLQSSDKEDRMRENDQMEISERERKRPPQLERGWMGLRSHLSFYFFFRGWRM